MHESTRLDILNLHERVNELYWAIVGIANDLEGQMEVKYISRPNTRTKMSQITKQKQAK